MEGEGDTVSDHIKRLEDEILLHISGSFQNEDPGNYTFSKKEVLDYLQKCFSNSRGTSVCSLTSRELEVLRATQHLGTARKVAEKLGISHETVKVHIKNAYKKLRVGSKKEALDIYTQYNES